MRFGFCFLFLMLFQNALSFKVGAEEFVLDLKLPVYETYSGVPFYNTTTDQAADLANSLNLFIYIPQSLILPEIEPNVLDIWGRTWPTGLFMLESWFLNYVPGSPSWYYKNFQKNILEKAGYSSVLPTSGFLDFITPPGVSGVGDSSLALLKQKNNPSLVRLGSAWQEGGAILGAEYSKSVFFRSRNIPKAANMARSILITNSFWYLIQETSFGGTNFIKISSIVTAPMSEPGPDHVLEPVAYNFMNSWTYHLFRPEAPGVKRFVGDSDLTSEETLYRNIQFWLSWMNFMDVSISTGKKWEVRDGDNLTAWYNIYLQHYLTPFGSSTNLSLLWQQAGWNLAGSLWNQVNGASYFPGLEAEIVDYTLPGIPVRLGLKTALWIQPQNYGFRTTEMQPGFLGQAVLDFAPWENFSLWIKMTGKTKGWYPGEDELNSSFRIGTGLRIKYNFTGEEDPEINTQNSLESP